MNQLKARLIKGVSFTILPVLYLLIHNSHRVRVLITYKDEILLQRSSVGHQKWSVPGGGVQRNESDEDAAIREVKEEVGIKLSLKDLKKLGWQRASYNKGWPYMNLTFFHVQLEKKQNATISRPLEILEAAWIPLNDLPSGRSQTIATALEFCKTASDKHVT